MLALQPSSMRISKLTPNLLPCAIHHSGPITAAERHWKPSTSAKDGISTAYLRGRKLRGRTVKLPQGYRGVLLQKTEELLLQKADETRAVVPASYGEDDGGEDVDGGEEDTPVEVKVMEQQAAFDEMVMWGHDAVPGDEDVYVKGVEEWIAFSHAIHAYDERAARS